MSAARRKQKICNPGGAFYSVHLKPGADNLIATLSAVISGKLPITTTTIRLDVLNRWAHDKQPAEGEAYGLIIQKLKGEQNEKSKA